MKNKMLISFLVIFTIASYNITSAQNQTLSNTSLNLTGTSTIKSNGNPGTSGQVLQSQGAGVPPIWVTPSGGGGGNIGQSGTTVYSTSSLGIDSFTKSYTLIPGVTQTINVPANAI